MLTELVILRCALLAYKAIHDIRRLNNEKGEQTELKTEAEQKSVKSGFAPCVTTKALSLGCHLASLAEQAIETVV